MPDFYQDPPGIESLYDADPLLRDELERRLPREVFEATEAQRAALGRRAVTDLKALGDEAERDPPRHVPFDAWGRRVDRIDVSSAWTALRRAATEEGLIATAYEGTLGGHGRLVQQGLLFLYTPTTSVYACPLAMTDGAARLISIMGDARLKERALPRLTTRDPDLAWTSGQWMTERTGGSDVGRGQTVATPGPDGEHLLYGTKWFTSAITSEMAFTLARPEGAAEGSRGLALFYVETRREDGALNGIEVLRLKDKLGTRAVPTAELTLRGARARIVGDAGEGVRRIASLMNVTRIWNASCAVAGLTYGLALAADYARRRVAFGRPLVQHPLHAETLLDIDVERRAGALLVLEAAALLGREEHEGSEDAARALRLLTPLAKLYTAKQAVWGWQELIEAMGGAGYVEDTSFPRMLRDANVLPIWEGTTNVLSLDCLRAIEREGALDPLLGALEERLADLDAPDLEDARLRVRAALSAVREEALPALQEHGATLARAFAYGLARAVAGALLIEHAAWAIGARPAPLARPAVIAASRWARRDLVPIRATMAERGLRSVAV